MAGMMLANARRAFNDMYYLIDKFAPFPDDAGPLRLVDAELQTLSSERDHTVS